MIPFRTQRISSDTPLKHSTPQKKKKIHPSQFNIPLFLHSLFAFPENNPNDTKGTPKFTRKKIQAIQHRYRRKQLTPSIHCLSKETLMIKKHTHNKGLIKELFQDFGAEEFQIFLQNLHHFESEKKSEIQELCQSKHDDFLGCLKSFEKTKTDIKIYRKNMMKLVYTFIVKRGAKYAKGLKVLEELEKRRKNMLNCRELTQVILKILDKFRKCMNEIEMKNFYISIKILNVIKCRLMLMKEFDIHEYFVMMHERLMEKVQWEVNSVFNEWIEMVRGRSMRVGGILMAITKERMSVVPERVVKSGLFGLEWKDDEVESVHECVLAIEKAEIELKSLLILVSCFKLMNFNAVKYYRKYRSAQITHFVLKHSKINLSLNRNVRFYPIFVAQFIEKVVGYFTIEYYVKDKTNLVSEFDFNNEWNEISVKMISLLRKNVEHVKSFQSLLEIKNTLITFCSIMKNVYDLNITSFLSLIKEWKDKYLVLMMTFFQKQLNTILSVDKESYFKVESNNMLNKLDAFGLFKKEQAPKIPFLCSFTENVPKILDIFDSFGENMVSFDKYIYSHDQMASTGLLKLMKFTLDGINKVLKQRKKSFVKSIGVSFFNCRLLHLDVTTILRGFSCIETTLKEKIEAASSLSLFGYENCVILNDEKSVSNAVVNKKQFVFSKEYSSALEISEELLKISMEKLFIFETMRINSGFYYCCWEEKENQFVSESYQKKKNAFFNEVVSFYERCFRDLFFLEPLRKKKLFSQAMIFLEGFILHRMSSHISLSGYKNNPIAKEVCIRSKTMNEVSIKCLLNHLNKVLIKKLNNLHKKLIGGEDIDLENTYFLNIKQLCTFFVNEIITPNEVATKGKTFFVKKFKQNVKNEELVRKLKLLLDKFKNQHVEEKRLLSPKPKKKKIFRFLF